MKKLFILVFVILVGSLLVATNNFQFFGHGAPKSAIYAKDGFLWYANEIGIVHYQISNENKTIITIPDIDTSEIEELVVDSNNNIWFTCNVMSEDSGLYKYDGSNLIQYNSTNSILTNVPRNFLYLDNLNKLWIGSDNNGLFQLDLNTNQWTSFTVTNSGIHSNQICSFIQDPSDNSYWIGSWDNGFCHYQDEIWTVYNVDTINQPLNWVTDLEITDDGKLWIGAHNGLFKKEGDQVSQINDFFKVERIEKLANNLLVQCYEDNLKVYETEYDYIAIVNAFAENMLTYNEKTFISNNYEFKFFENSQYESTLQTLNPGNIDYPELFTCIKTNQNKDKIYLLTENKFAMFTNHQWTYYSLENTGIDFSKTSFLNIDADNNVYLLMTLENSRRFIKFDGSNWSILSSLPLSLSAYIKSICIDHNNLIWIVYDHTLAYYEEGEIHIAGTNIGIITTDLKVDNDNNLWFGTYDGMIKRYNGQLEDIYYNNQGTSSQIFDLDPLNANTCYYVSNGKLFSLIHNENQQLAVFPYSYEHVDLMVENANLMWIRCFNEFYKFDGENLEQFTSRFNFTYTNQNCMLVDSDNNKWYMFNNNLMVYNESGVTEQDNPLIISNQINLQNYPNPFNPETNIAFTLAKDALVKLKIFNIKGQLVKEFSEIQAKNGFNTISWNAKDNIGKTLTSGVYFVRLSVDSHHYVHKMLLMK